MYGPFFGRISPVGAGLGLTSTCCELSIRRTGNNRSSDVAGRQDVIERCYRSGNVAVMGRFISSNFSNSGFSEPNFDRVVTRLGSKFTGVIVAGSLSELNESVARSDCCTRACFPRGRVRCVTVDSGFSSGRIGVVTPFRFTVGSICLQSASQGVGRIVGRGEAGNRCYTYPPFNCVGGGSNATLRPSPGATPVIRGVFTVTRSKGSTQTVTATLARGNSVAPLGCHILCHSGFNRENTTETISR